VATIGWFANVNDAMRVVGSMPARSVPLLPVTSTSEAIAVVDALGRSTVTKSCVGLGYTLIAVGAISATFVIERSMNSTSSM
jgi:predicted methyltransferase